MVQSLLLLWKWRGWQKVKRKREGGVAGAISLNIVEEMKKVNDKYEIDFKIDDTIKQFR